MSIYGGDLKDINIRSLYSLQEKSIFRKAIEKIVQKNLKDNKNSTTNTNSTKSLTQEEQKKLEKEADISFEELLKAFKVALSKVKKYPDFKNKCKESSQEVIDCDEDIKLGYIPPLTVEEWESLFPDYVILVNDESQIVRQFYNWILEDMIAYIKDNYKELYKNWNFEIGDGDEGCIYATYNYIIGYE